MLNKSRFRIGIYFLIVVVFFFMVVIRQNQIKKERAKPIVSSIDIWQSKGIPVRVEKVKAEDVPEYTRLTVSLSKDDKWAGFVSKNIKQKLAADQNVYGLNDQQQAIGKIKSIDDELSLDTGMFRVWMDIGDLKQVPLTRNIVLVKTNVLKNVINIPNHIIDIKQGDFYVWKVNDNIAKQQEIKIRSRNGYGVIVESGISAADILVYSGQSALRDGQKIQVINEKQDKINF